jgi:hypothetical protein
MNDLGCCNNAGVLPASLVIRRLLFSFYLFSRSSESSIKEGSDLRSRPLDPRYLIMPDINYIALRCRLTDYYVQENKEIRISGFKDPVRPPDLNNSVKSL